MGAIVYYNCNLTMYILRCLGANFTKQLSKNLALRSFLSETFTLIPYHKILSLNLRYFMKLASCAEIKSEVRRVTNFLNILPLTNYGWTYGVLEITETA